MINNESAMFSKSQVETIENLRKAIYVCSTEHKGIPVEVFYGSQEHPVSKSRYFALYRSNGILMITDGSFIEDQEIEAVVANNGEIIYSRYRHDYRTSKDGSVFIDGGRAYTRCSLDARRITLIIRHGVLQKNV
jgi:outer membrane protein assembly factor BamB